MKKVLVPVEAERYPQELLDLVAVLAPVSPIQLTAALFSTPDYAGAMDTGNALLAGTGFDEEGKARTMHCHSRVISRFCEEREIAVRVHMENNEFALPSLEQQTRFTDLLLISSRHFYQSRQPEQPNSWMKEILQRSECPVILVPDGAALPGEILLAYDGSSDCMYAIRQFSYLFPEFKGVQVTLVFMSEDHTAAIPEEQAIREWCMLHFTRFRVERIQAKGGSFYSSWIRARKNPWLVAGSYGRRNISALSTTNFLSELVWDHRICVFISHN